MGHGTTHRIAMKAARGNPPRRCPGPPSSAPRIHPNGSPDITQRNVNRTGGSSPIVRPRKDGRWARRSAAGGRHSPPPSSSRSSPLSCWRVRPAPPPCCWASTKCRSSTSPRRSGQTRSPKPRQASHTPLSSASRSRHDAAKRRWPRSPLQAKPKRRPIPPWRRSPRNAPQQEPRTSPLQNPAVARASKSKQRRACPRGAILKQRSRHSLRPVKEERDPHRNSGSSSRGPLRIGGKRILLRP